MVLHLILTFDGPNQNAGPSYSCVVLLKALQKPLVTSTWLRIPYELEVGLHAHNVDDVRYTLMAHSCLGHLSLHLSSQASGKLLHPVYTLLINMYLSNHTN